MVVLVVQIEHDGIGDLPAKVLTSKQVKDVIGGALDAGSKDASRIRIS